MARNNQAEDRYNPPSVAQAGNDFETINFSEVEESDLFWLKNGGNDNPAYRKINDREAGNTKTRVLETFNSNDRVYQRT
tara:strand:+ start:98 stop:334 length:237 start_codon:yes stop_codon:yes gene_type:complete